MMSNYFHSESNQITLDNRSKYLRYLILTALKSGKRGHLGPAMSLVEIVRVLYDDVLQFDPHNPNWVDRDRCILSKGHGCLALYALLVDKGFFSIDEIHRFCHFNAMLGGHPESTIPGVEATTGSLGHGLSVGVGMAIAAKMKSQSHRVFVIMGDGELNEGSVWEAALCAATHQLANLTAIIDRNHLQSYGNTEEIVRLEPLKEKWQSFGFLVQEINGHDLFQLRNALMKTPFDSNKPSVIISHTVKGKGIVEAENNPAWHHKASLSENDIARLFDQLDYQPEWTCLA